MFRRAILVALVIGTSLSVAATGTVSVRLVFGTTLAWSFTVLIQMAAALAIISTARDRTLPVGAAMAAFFDLHVPWSTWFLCWAAWTWIAPPALGHSAWALYTGLVPAVWTAALIYTFARRVLAEPHRAALTRTVAHQAIVWTAFLLIGGAAVGLWPRVLQVLGG